MVLLDVVSGSIFLLLVLFPYTVNWYWVFFPFYIGIFFPGNPNYKWWSTLWPRVIEESFFSTFTASIPAVQGGSITKGIPGTRMHQDSSISYRGGSITQVSSEQQCTFRRSGPS